LVDVFQQIQGNGNTTYTFIATPSQLATGQWELSWQVNREDYADSNAGTLEIKAYFNSVLLYDQIAAASTYELAGSISVNLCTSLECI
jgi:hypothetical protein